MEEAGRAATVRMFGRYALHGPIASGGMATVHYGRLLGPVGFSRTVAIKRLHAEHARDPEFVMGFLDEARLAARIRHPNVVPTIDVVAEDGELFLVMEYVEGESLSKLIRMVTAQDERVPPPIACAILSGMLRGLHAAHIAKSEQGTPLDIVHRDVSPQNVIVGIDGLAHVVDFGVAKASGRLQTTREGSIKGKLAYMAPEMFAGVRPTRRVDIYGAGVVLWETITGRRLFAGENEAEIIGKVMTGKVEKPSALVPNIPEALDAVIAKSLHLDPARRYASAEEMATALEASLPQAIPATVSTWVVRIAGDILATRAHLIAEIESSSSQKIPEDQLAQLSPSGRQLPNAPSAPSAPSSPRLEHEVTVRFDTASQVTDSAMIASHVPQRSRRPPIVILALLGITVFLGLAATIGVVATRAASTPKALASANAGASPTPSADPNAGASAATNASLNAGQNASPPPGSFSPSSAPFSPSSAPSSPPSSASSSTNADAGSLKSLRGGGGKPVPRGAASAAPRSSNDLMFGDPG